MKIHFVFNDTNWATTQSKVDNVVKFFAPDITIQPTILHTSFKNIPLVKVTTTNGVANTIGSASTVDPVWYDKNVTPLCPLANIIVFYLSPTDYTVTTIPIGIEQGKIGGVVQTCLFGIKETDSTYVLMNNVETNIGNSYEIFAEHEISHALYLLQNKNDNTHIYFYSGVPTGVLTDLKQPNTLNLLWNTPTNCEHSIRVMCDDAGLSVNDKNILDACIHQESNYNPSAESPVNTDGTHDWGICQFNDGKNSKGNPYWIGAGAIFPDVQYVLNNPQECVAEMIAQYKLGHIRWWASFTTGAYLKYMPK